MEVCFICRRQIPAQEICRRVLPVSQSCGWTLSAVPGLSFFVYEAPVSLCPACEAAIVAQQRPGLGGWVLVAVCGLLVLALVEWLFAAIVNGIWVAWQESDYKVVAFCLGLASVSVGRLVRRIRAARVKVHSPTTEVDHHPCKGVAAAGRIDLHVSGKNGGRDGSKKTIECG